jgi:hypothetical protein
MNRSKATSSFRCEFLKLCSVAAAVVVIAAIAWAADTPWKSKPYQKWTDSDIHRILFDSPWAHAAVVDATWRAPGDAEASSSDFPEPSAPPSGNMGRPALSPGAMPNGGAPNDAGAGANQSAVPTAHYDVDWISSKTMRAALAQRDVLHAGKTAAEAAQYVDEPEPDYVILVQGADMRPFLRADEKYFQANSFLQLKKPDRKVSPEKVEFQRNAAGNAVVAALFFFAKKLPDGGPLILPDEKSIEFTSKVGGSTLKVTFEPQKMTTRSGPDL